MDENELGTIVVDIALEIHRELGPGLLESVYEVVLAHALRERGLRIERQVPISIKYRGLVFEEGFRADIIVQQRLLLEIKCVEALANVHKKTTAYIPAPHGHEARLSIELQRSPSENRHCSHRQWTGGNT